MARDYGRMRNTRTQSGSKQFLQWLFAFLIGYLAASMFDFASLSHWVQIQWLAQQNVPHKSQEKSRHAELPKPKFEFYTLLANGRTTPHNPQKPVKKPLATSTQFATQSAPTTTLITPQKLTPNITAQTTPTPPNPSKKENYGVQVASFKTYPEAEKMKAALILKGFATNISPVSQPQGIWYRVIIGPYPSKLEALRMQASFAKSEHVVGMVRKIEGQA